MQLRDDIAANPPPEEEGDGNEPSRAMESDVVVVKRRPITSVVMKRVRQPYTQEGLSRAVPAHL